MSAATFLGAVGPPGELVVAVSTALAEKERAFAQRIHMTKVEREPGEPRRLEPDPPLSELRYAVDRLGYMPRRSG